MTGLLSPLSPTSVNLLSRTPTSFNERLKQSTASTPSPDDHKTTSKMADIPPSSPFQPHVGAPSAAPSPDKFYTAKPGQRSPVKGFDIHCDDLEMLGGNLDEIVAAKDDFKVPDLRSRRPSEDTMKGFDLSLRDVPIAQDKKMDFMDDFNDDLSVCDEQTVLSEDTCFSTFSAVPNADMTQFANLGNRTANHILAEMVNYLSFRPEDQADLSNRHHEVNHLAHLPRIESKVWHLHQPHLDDQQPNHATTTPQASFSTSPSNLRTSPDPNVPLQSKTTQNHIFSPTSTTSALLARTDPSRPQNELQS